MPAKTHGERFDGLEQVVSAEGHIALEKNHGGVGHQLERMDQDRARTEAQFHETDAKIPENNRESAQRSRELDQRVDKLVRAIAELIRKQDALKS